jgi:hypothetical protein
VTLLLVSVAIDGVFVAVVLVAVVLIVVFDVDVAVSVMSV